MGWGHPYALLLCVLGRVQTGYLQGNKRNCIGGWCSSGGVQWCWGDCLCRSFGHWRTSFFGVSLRTILLATFLYMAMEASLLNHVSFTLFLGEETTLDSSAFLFGVYLSLLGDLLVLPSSFCVLFPWPFAFVWLLEPPFACLGLRPLSLSSLFNTRTNSFFVCLGVCCG